jgi:uncharacterized protein (DUF111 family)
MTLIAWITGTTDLTAPEVALALAQSGAGPVTALQLGPAPAMTPIAVGVSGAVRVVVGEVSEQLMVSANVDDLDPRVWPSVLRSLLAAGAVDAWLTPILMKKGRPAHTVTALVPSPVFDAVRTVFFTETTSIGLRVHSVDKTALARTESTVQVGGCNIRVKIARDGDAVRNVMPEWDDVEAAATELGLPARRVLSLAHATAQELWGV